MVRLEKPTDKQKARNNPADAVRIPLDYAPRMRERDARREKWVNRVVFALLSFLMWTVFVAAGVGVYLCRTDGWESGWLFLVVAFGSLCLIIGACCTSERVRRILRSEV